MRERFFSPPAKNTISSSPNHPIHIALESRVFSPGIIINQSIIDYDRTGYFCNGSRLTTSTIGPWKLFTAHWDQFFRTSRRGRCKLGTLPLWHLIHRCATEWTCCDRGLLRNLSKVLC